MFFYAVAIFLEKEFTNRYEIVLVIYELAAATSLFFLLLGTASHTLEGTIIQIISQKIGIYTEIITQFLLAYATWKQLERFV